MTSQAAKGPGTILATNIKVARAGKGWTQRELAAKLGTDQLAVSRWERGENSPSDSNLMRLCEALGQTVAWFYTDHEDPVAA